MGESKTLPLYSKRGKGSPQVYVLARRNDEGTAKTGERSCKENRDNVLGLTTTADISDPRTERSLGLLGEKNLTVRGFGNINLSARGANHWLDWKRKELLTSLRRQCRGGRERIALKTIARVTFLGIPLLFRHEKRSESSRPAAEPTNEQGPVMGNLVTTEA